MSDKSVVMGQVLLRSDLEVKSAGEDHSLDQLGVWPGKGIATL